MASGINDGNRRDDVKYLSRLVVFLVEYIILCILVTSCEYEVSNINVETSNKPTLLS
jgi:hypothetical protein